MAGCEAPAIAGRVCGCGDGGGADADAVGHGGGAGSPRWSARRLDWLFPIPPNPHF